MTASIEAAHERVRTLENKLTEATASLRLAHERYLQALEDEDKARVAYRLALRNLDLATCEAEVPLQAPAPIA